LEGRPPLPNQCSRASGCPAGPGPAADRRSSRWPVRHRPPRHDFEAGIGPSICRSLSRAACSSSTSMTGSLRLASTLRHCGGQRTLTTVIPSLVSRSTVRLAVSPKCPCKRSGCCAVRSRRCQAETPASRRGKSGRCRRPQCAIRMRNFGADLDHRLSSNASDAMFDCVLRGLTIMAGSPSACFNGRSSEWPGGRRSAPARRPGRRRRLRVLLRELPTPGRPAQSVTNNSANCSMVRSARSGWRG